MATDTELRELAQDAAEVAEVATPTTRRRKGPRVDPNDLISPTCMIWAMWIGLGLLVAIMVMWGISNADKIVQ
ncbi:MAG TPA: hypothetical protein VFR15_08305 [Chloroflexia bacterium]|nr:hypothetical protein [Chloroflexia bacterium]